MVQQQLAGCRIKIKRAKKHINDLEKEIVAFRDRNPYLVVKDFNAQTGLNFWQLKVREDIPEMWPAIIGDAIHNLRSSLDILGCALVLHQSPGANISSIHFPIGANLNVFEAGLAKHMKRASQKAVRTIRRLKPYKGGNTLLWQLHQLDIRDKHQLIIPVGSTHKSTLMTVVATDPDTGRQERLRPMLLSPEERVYPLEDGAILFRLRPTDPNVETNYQFAFDIAFGEGQIVDGEPVVATLRKLVNLTERIIDIFENRILK